MLLARRGYALAVVCLFTMACGSQQQPSAPSSTAAQNPSSGAANGVQLVGSPTTVTGAFTPEPDDQDTTPETGVEMPTPGRASAPAGFEARIVTQPRPDGDGVIHGGGALTVTFDGCRSNANPGARLFYLFDFDFNSRADVISSGRDCSAARTYKAKATPTGGPPRNFRANMCVANGDPRADDPSTFYACRSFKIAVDSLTCAVPSIKLAAPVVAAVNTTFNFDMSGFPVFLVWNGRLVAEGLPPNWNLTPAGVLQARPTTSGTYVSSIEAKTPCGTASLAWTIVVI